MPGPLNDDQLAELLLNHESDRVERAESPKDKDKLCRAVCSFANDLPGHGLPGVLFIGVRDDESALRFTDTPVTDETLRNLAGIRDDGNVLPRPSLSVFRWAYQGHELAVVAVEPQLETPVRYKGQVHVRIGPRRSVATVEEEHRLAERRRSKEKTFDLWPCPTARLDDLDSVLIERVYLPQAISEEVLRENHRPLALQLATLRLAEPEEPWRPTYAGILAVGKNPKRHVPGAYVQFVRFEGTEYSSAIRDQAEISGPLPDLVSRIDDKIAANITVATDFTSGPVEVTFPDYPAEALRQLTRNAIMHRDYHLSNAPVRLYWFSDRVEILNPGGPFGAVTIENFGSGLTDYRNPALAEAMRVFKIVQRFGVGIQVARTHCQDNGNPPPEFEPMATYVKVTVRKSEKTRA